MKNKCTTTARYSQHLIAGLLEGDNNIEFFGIPETMEVQWMQNGHCHPFKELSPVIFALLGTDFNANTNARNKFRDMKENGCLLSFPRKVEIYTYYMFGGLDASPDVINGELQEPENHRHTKNCISLDFKTIKLNGSPLKRREIEIIDCMEEDLTGDTIAEKLGWAASTYNQHKKEIFTKTGVQTTTALMIAAARQGILKILNPATA